MACQDDLLGLHQQGMLVAVPNPDPADTAAIEEAIQTALRDADKDGITGAAVTPYVLARVEKLTQGRSLDANVALVKNNAKVAADISIQYSALSSRRPSASLQSAAIPPAAATATPTATPTTENMSITKSATGSTSASGIIHRPEVAGRPNVLVIGGAVVDQVMTPKASSDLLLHTSNPGSISTNYGGVGRNIAEAIGRLGDCNVSLVSAVGGDAQGAGLLRHASEAGVDVAQVIRGSAQDRTAVYAAVHDHTGDLVVAIADMDIFARVLNVDVITALEGKVKRAQLVVTDGNITPECFASVAECCESNGVPLFFEPTSVHKCTVPVLAKVMNKVCSLASN
jgi:pseudouridylate synthase / pseudouridine kinase